MRRTLIGLAGLAIAGHLAACFSSQNSPQPDAGPEDAATLDGGTPDAPQGDATLGDASSMDSSVADVALGDARADTSVVDSGVDSGIADATPEVFEAGYDAAPDVFEAGYDAPPDVAEAATDAATVSLCTPLDAGGAPSCAPGGAGMTNCGTTSECCCASPEVTGGTYYRTYANYGAGPTGEADPATISGFRLDKYDVTVGRFRQFVNAVLPADGGAGWLPPVGSGKHTHVNAGQGLVDVSADAGTPYETGWRSSYNASVSPTTANLTTNCNGQGYATYATWTGAPGSQETLPINCMNWFEAYAFCIWDGGFLPSEAEWEYAAAGGNQQRAHPWGTAQPTTPNQYGNFGCDYPTGSPSCSGLANIWPVGTAPMGAGLWGQLDLAGNLDQINMDFDPPFASPCVDCANLTPQSAGGHEVHGGDYNNSYEDIWTRAVGWSGTTRTGLYTFRCARVP